jgi:hypothetical protein
VRAQSPRSPEKLRDAVEAEDQATVPTFEGRRVRAEAEFTMKGGTASSGIPDAGRPMMSVDARVHSRHDVSDIWVVDVRAPTGYRSAEMGGSWRPAAAHIACTDRRSSSRRSGRFA